MADRRSDPGRPDAQLRSEPGPGRAPWLAWGPYLWGDGLNARSDLLQWECGDLEADGTHPSEAGEGKVASLLFDFFRSDATAKTWFLESPTTLCRSQATAEKYGTGVAGAGGTVQLVASTLPTLPTQEPFLAHVFGAPPGALAVFVSGFSAHAPGAVPLFGGSLLVKVWKSQSAVTDVYGKSSISFGFLPDDPGFCGQPVFMQVGVVDATAPVGWGLSRGLRLRVGH